jgi:hypothetical protein
MPRAIRYSLSVLFLLVCLSAAAQERYLCTSLTYPLGFRIGTERPLGSRTGIKADIGLEMLQLPAADLFFLVYLLPPDRRIRLNLALGVPTTMVGADFKPLHLYSMVSFGGSLVIGWRLRSGRSLDLRLGGGVPLFFGEKDKPVLRPLRIPRPGGGGVMEIYFWPDLALGLNFRR